MPAPTKVETLSLQQCADELGIHRSVVTRMAKNGQFPSIQSGRRWITLRPWFEDFKRTYPFPLKPPPGAVHAVSEAPE